MIKMSHTKEALTKIVEPMDPRRDHRRMLIDAEARHWRVLDHLSRGLGKRKIASIEACSGNSIQRSYGFLRQRGLIAIGEKGRYEVTHVGSSYLEEGDR